MKLISDQRGFTLINSAIGIMVLGIMVAAIGTLHVMYKRHQLDKELTLIMAQVNAAIRENIEFNGRLPCPAPLTAAVDTADFGREVGGGAGCVPAMPAGVFETTGRAGGKIVIGTVPTRSLNIDDVLMFDPFNHRLIYAVTAEPTIPGADFESDMGAISVIDSQDNHMTSSAGNVVFVVMAPGQDRRGAYGFNGTLLAPCDDTTLAGENCDNDDVFRATIYKSY